MPATSCSDYFLLGLFTLGLIIEAVASLGAGAEINGMTLNWSSWSSFLVFRAPKSFLLATFS